MLAGILEEKPIMFLTKGRRNGSWWIVGAGGSRSVRGRRVLDPSLLQGSNQLDVPFDGLVQLVEFLVIPQRIVRPMNLGKNLDLRGYDHLY